eukprot:3313052-Amphidinium_carterae.1
MVSHDDGPWTRLRMATWVIQATLAQRVADEVRTGATCARGRTAKSGSQSKGDCTACWARRKADRRAT